MRALKYFLNEAAESLLRSWRSAALAVLTIAAGLFVLGFFLMVNSNLQRVVGRWSEAAEMSVYLKDDATREQVQALEALIDQSGLSDKRQYLSKADALARFREDFPDLAGATERLERNPLPASLEMRLGPAARTATAAVDDLAARLGSGARRGRCALRPAVVEPTRLGCPVRPHCRPRHRRAPRCRRGHDGGQCGAPRGLCPS